MWQGAEHKGSSPCPIAVGISPNSLDCSAARDSEYNMTQKKGNDPKKNTKKEANGTWNDTKAFSASALAAASWLSYNSLHRASNRITSCKSKSLVRNYIIQIKTANPNVFFVYRVSATEGFANCVTLPGSQIKVQRQRLKRR